MIGDASIQIQTQESAEVNTQGVDLGLDLTQ